jgi:hypothetical protein
MTPYEFRTISHGKTIWTVEHYCLDHADAFVQAKKSSAVYEVQVSQSDIRLVFADQPCNARVEELRQRIALYRGFLEDGSRPQQTEFYLVQICESEDELAQLEITTRKVH